MNAHLAAAVPRAGGSIPDPARDRPPSRPRLHKNLPPKTAMHRLLTTALLLALAHSAPALDWPQFRGPARDDVSRETGLLKQWPAEGPRRVWLFEKAGSGYSGFSVVGGKLFTLGTRDNQELLLALDAETGKELWAAPLGEILQNNWGNGPRGTPPSMATKSSPSPARARLSAPG